MKIVIIFHSVCGNTYLMAQEFYNAFKEKKQNVEMYRVEDSTLDKTAQIFAPAQDFLTEIKKISVAAPQVMENADLILLGSPTYFGNVSGQMKLFMDATSPLWIKGKFIGKKLLAFASAGNSEGGGDLCLQAINVYGQHMGMLNVSVPSNIKPGITVPAYGILHYSGNGSVRPDKNKLAIAEMVNYLLLS
ncbi:MAG: NAD(P)H-dependent oxidoreductase [Candidatus Omnitrophica bacterium]|nr:NAD(P)H-dependent oxidoreductase [Candidatus Omnitrophota bacterium]